MRSNSILLLVFLCLNFSTWAQVPVITSFTPSSGKIGSSVTINGSNFSSNPEENIVFFGPVKAIVTAASADQLSVTVPPGAGSEKISVNINGLVSYSKTPFFIPFESNEIIDASAFAINVDLTTGTEPQRLAVADLDEDGKIDIVVVNYQSNTISVFKNLSSAGDITTGSFKAKVDYPTGNNPFGVILADFDGDGKKDIAVSNFSSNTISIFKNTSTKGSLTSPSFASKVDFSTGNNPQNMCAGDLDGDGKLELTVANATSNTVSVFRNTCTLGSITSASFAPKVDFSASTYPWSIAIEDLDGDAKPEMTVVNGSSNTLSIYKNNSTTGTITSSSFASKQDFATSEGPVSIVVADFDEDGKSDLAVGCVDTYLHGAQISVFRNTSTTSAFSLSRKDVTPSGLPMFLAVADIDGDKKLDLAVANEYQSNVSVLKNNSTPGNINLSLNSTPSSTQSTQDFTTAGAATGIAVADMDGDGKTDLVAACSHVNAISVLRNIMDVQIVPVISSFTPEEGVIGTIVKIAGSNFSSTPENNIVTFGTLKATVISASETELNVRVPYGANDQPITVLVNGLSATSNKPFRVTFTSSTPIDITEFGPTISLSNSYKIGAVGDLDMDGKLDVVGFLGSGTDFCGNTYVSVYRNNSTPGELTQDSFEERQDFGINGPSCPGFPYFAKIADLDGDSRPEIIVFTTFIEYVGNTGNVVIFKNTSQSGQINSTSFATSLYIPSLNVGTANGLDIADIDGDGKPDIIISHIRKGSNGAPAGSAFSILRNTTAKGTISSSSFMNPVEFILSGSGSSLKVADIDGDQKPDVVTANNSLSTISIFRNTSTFGKIDASSLSSRQDFGSGNNPIGLTVADFNGDGKVDIATGNYNGNSASVFRNMSTSGVVSLASRQEFGVGQSEYGGGNQPKGTAAGDFDGDGKMDMILANSSGNTLSFFRNTTTTAATTLTFDTKQDLQASLYPNDVNIADFDGDGKNDLITNAYESSLYILRNPLAGPPSILSFSSPGGSVGSSMTIYGTDFTGATTVKFNNTNASDFTINSPISITVTIPTGATTGKISVTTSEGTAISTEDFNVCTKPAKPSISVSYEDPYMPRLTSSATEGNQWFKNGLAIPGATEQFYDVTEDALYMVQVTINECQSDFSEEYNIITGTEEEINSMKLYPNPVQEYLRISGLYQKIVGQYITDVSGRTIKVKMELNGENAIIDVKDLEKGIYFLKIQTLQNNLILKFIKE